MTDPRDHVVKTLCFVDKVKQTVNVGLLCDVCGEIQLPAIPYTHVKAFAKLLSLAGAQLNSPDFVYVPSGPNDGLVDQKNVAELDKILDTQNVISEVLRMSKTGPKKG